MIKVSHGNMYDWVTHMHAHLGGECPHKCSYCYVGKAMHGRPDKYAGPIRLLRHELDVNYGFSRTIFIEHMNDLFAEGVPDEWIKEILGHCCKFPKNHFVFQTKNPQRAVGFYSLFPQFSLVGTTIETNRELSHISKAPSPKKRFEGIRTFACLSGLEIFITVEPILDFDVKEFADSIVYAKPTFVNIGADSKGCGLVEPSPKKIEELVKILNKNQVFIRKKHNLDRLLGVRGGVE